MFITSLNCQEFEAHNETEEHNYHITRKIGTLVPGLAFCAVSSHIMILILFIIITASKDSSNNNL